MKTLIAFDLKVPFKHPFNDDLNLEDLPTDRYYHIDAESSEISHAFRLWADSVGCRVAGAEIFCFPEDFDMEIHIDGTKFSNKHKINWTYSEASHEMSWYKPTSNWPGRKTTYSQDDGKTDDYSFAFLPDEVERIARTEVKGNGSNLCTVVNSGLPHGIKTMGGTRISFSATLYPKSIRTAEKDWGVDIHDAYEQYKKFVVNDTEIWVDYDDSFYSKF